MFAKQERWTEEEVNGLPAGEHDYFERKSGLLFENPADRSPLLDNLSKAISAFANSGGGHLVLESLIERSLIESFIELMSQVFMLPIFHRRTSC